MRERNYQMCRLLLLTDVIGDGGCRFWQPVQADSQPKSSGLVMGRRPLGAVLHSSNEPGELSQWLCHDDSTINIVLDIIIYYYSLFGHICRLPENTPASQALQLSIEAHTGTPPAADWKRLPAIGRRHWPICWCCLDRGPGSFDVEDATTLSWSSAAVSEWVSVDRTFSQVNSAFKQQEQLMQF